MKLTGNELERLRDAFVDAYDRASMEELLVFRFDEQQEALLPSDADFNSAVFHLLGRAKREGWLRELITNAAHERSRNEEFTALCEELLNKYPPYNDRPSDVNDQAPNESSESTTSGSSKTRTSGVSPASQNAKGGSTLQERLVQTFSKAGMPEEPPALFAVTSAEEIRPADRGTPERPELPEEKPSALSFLRRGFPYRRGWLILVACLAILSLIGQAACLQWRSPAIITDLQFAGEPETAQQVLSAWQQVGITPGGVAGNLWFDVLFLLCYAVLLNWLCLWAKRQFADGLLPGPGEHRMSRWMEAVSPLIILLGLVVPLLDLGENVGLGQMLRPPVNEAATRLVFVLATTKMFLLGLIGWYALSAVLRWRWLLGAWEAARWCGFSIFAAIMAPCILLFGGQGREVYLAVEEHRTDNPAVLRWTLIAIVLFSLMCWRAARYVASYRIGSPSDAGTFRRGWWDSRIWTPRLCGILPPFILAFLFAGPGAGWTSFVFWGTLLVGLAVSAWICFRRALFQRFKKGDQFLDKIDLALAGLVVGGGLVFAIYACQDPEHLQNLRGMGPLAAWLLSFSLMVPFFTLLVWLGRSFHIPALAFFLAYGFLCNIGNLNDDHGVRHRYYKEASPASAPATSEQPDLNGLSPWRNRPTLNEAFDTWLEQRGAQKWSEQHGGKPYPVVFISAAGGGIAAACIVTVTMAQFETDLPELEQHLFAISGVSGGSLGAVIYTTLRQADHEKIGEKAKLVLTEDMLTPSVASLLSPELVQRFLFFSLEMPDSDGYTNAFRMDRGRALDLALEHAFERAAGVSHNGKVEVNDKEAKRLRDLIQSPLSQYPTPQEAETGKAPLPALFFGTTDVETGERMVISTLRPDTPGALPFETLYAVDPRIDLQRSTAACLSARFPVISPPGFLPQQRQTVFVQTKGDEHTGGLPVTRPITVKRRYVDGGYCENTGAQTAMDIITALEQGDHRGKPRPSWTPVLISIYLSPSDETRPARDPREIGVRAARPRRGGGFDELFGPVGAFFNGWGGPPQPELRKARVRFGQGFDTSFSERFVEMPYPKPDILGWYLSRKQYDAATTRATALLQDPKVGGKIRTILSGTRKLAP